MSGTQPQLTCREVVELITMYLEDALGEPDRARFEVHVAGCRPCTEYLAQYRRTIAVAGRLDADALSPQARETLFQAFRSWRAGRDEG